MKTYSLSEAPLVRHELSRNLLSENVNSEMLEPLVQHLAMNELEQLTSLINRSISNKQSDAVLISGLPGSGKTALVETALKRVESNLGNKQLVVIRLSSIHSTDEMAIEDIAFQIEAQTGTSLKEIAATNEEVVIGDRFGKVMSLLTANTRSFALVFVLDPLEIFAARRSQGLLYTLVDSIHSADKLPICVIALSNRFGVLELLEKRVRSRFSGEQLLISPCLTNEKMLDISKLFLHVNLLKASQKEKEMAKTWNKHVDTFLESTETKEVFKQWMDRNPTVRDIKNIFCSLVFQSVNSTFIETLDHVRLASKVESYYNPPCHVSLQSLSILELSLFICFHVAVTSQHQPVLLEAAYAVYEQFVRRHHEARFFCSKATALRAFEKLIDAGLIQRQNVDSCSGSAGWTGRTAAGSVSRTSSLYQCSMQHFDLVEYLSANNVAPELHNFARVNLQQGSNRKLFA